MLVVWCWLFLRLDGCYLEFAYIRISYFRLVFPSFFVFSIGGFIISSAIRGNILSTQYEINKTIIFMNNGPVCVCRCRCRCRCEYEMSGGAIYRYAYGCLLRLGWGQMDEQMSDENIICERLFPLRRNDGAINAISRDAEGGEWEKVGAR